MAPSMSLPGDFAAVRLESPVGVAIRVGELLNGDGFRDYEHAIFYVGGQDLILEAGRAARNWCRTTTTALGCRGRARTRSSG